ncbi:Ribonucleases P/MRP protein subunit POP1 [Frankliniella fusca]|uniref:Ribonucleases P/MRP protein subunit POP1 n=1 Tax=Frankliniella fusca TaxID=407009 RepID=A0AAE1H301_9NEOP|nr:Ribonucleases P/MRP protein subunit POP1 [Frankliniella fusca]
MASKLQFDALLGGDTEVPIEVNTMRFATARAQEIAAISQALDDSKGKLIFQRLPRHMRRRVMGHNPKRMPRNLRDAHAQQLLKSSGGSVTKHKKPSRKHRRRPANLLQEYNRRQRTFVWLETHIWHAKRFHMTERWGYRLALFPNDRSYRACYRAAANHCLLQDVSFLCCIELTGPLNMLLEGLSKHTYKGLTFAAECYLDGTREGEVMFYESGKAPWQPIGRVSFIWKPCNSSMPLEERKLWIWAHPAFYQNTIAALADTFQFTSCDSDNSSQSGECYPNYNGPVEKKAKIENVEEKSVEEQKLATKNVPFERTPKFASNCNRIQMALLKDTLNRFRLTGPLSQGVLKEALQLVSQTNDNPYNFSDTGLASIARVEENPISSEVTLLDTDPHGREVHHGFWLSNQGLPSPGEFPPKLILSLTVKDPRLQIPDKRTKAAPTAYETRCAESPYLPPTPYVSPIWSPKIRDTVTKSKLSTSELNALRSKLLVPGLLRTAENKDRETDSRCRLEASVASKIPIMLVQRPGSQDPSTKRLGFGCGWDVIFPAGWAMPFWMAFIFRCARPSGLREASAHELEKGLCGMFPPDSKAGVEEMLYIENDLRNKYFRLPPSKRPNFIKLGISCPFKCEWSSLIRDWLSSEEESVSSNNTEEMAPVSEQYFVLRDKNILLEVNKLISEIWSSLQKKICADNNQENCSTLMTKFPKFTNQNYSLLSVRLEAVHKGVTDDMSIICIPSSEDIIKILTNSSKNDFVEPPNPDKNQDLRQKLRHDHKKLLLRLRRQRVRSKRKLEQQNEDSNQSTTNKQKSLRVNYPTHDLVAAHKSKMEQLWLPNTNAIGSVKNACSRETAGFVTKGNFSFTEAKGCGVGYIPYLALQKLLQRWIDSCPQKIVSTVNSESFVVLVRSPNSYQYRLAKLFVIVS